MKGGRGVDCRWVGRALLLAVLMSVSAGNSALAQECYGMGEGLEFSHPLIAESVSPDTKIRLELDRSRGPSSLDMALEGEYAFVPQLSVEVGIPLEHAEAGGRSVFPGPMEVRTKYVHYVGGTGALGGGATIRLPVQEDPGEGGRRYGLTPFVDGGLRHGAWEWVAFGRVDLVNHVAPGDAAARLGYNASALYRLSRRVHALAELEGDVPLDGDVAGQGTLALSPGVKVWPGLGPHVMLGAAVSLPLLNHREFDSSLSLSIFYHF